MAEAGLLLTQNCNGGERIRPYDRKVTTARRLRRLKVAGKVRVTVKHWVAVLRIASDK